MRTRITLALGMALVMGVCSSHAEEEIVFQDSFAGKLGDGWVWLREDANTWRFKDDALEIRVEPGVASTVKNALVRKAPDRSTGTFAIDVTVTNAVVPIQQYEQAGITWYHDGKPILKLVKELIDGELYVFPGKKPMTSQTVQLRLIVSANRWVGQFRPDGKGEFITAAEGELPPPQNDEVSVQCYNGPPHAEHWIRFSDFRITRLAD